MKYANPIVSGMHPDPSVCRVGNDYYLVNSTFEYFPGIPVYHSIDLIHWEQVGHVITRPSQLSLPKGAPNCIAIYAPTIRYANGIFYCIVTNVGGEGNIIFSTDDIHGEWSDPVLVEECGGIDPSLFFDDDGKVYYSGICDHIFIAQIDVTTGKLLSQKVFDWDGSGANNPEGPHIYKIGGYYYLMIAEGGTEAGHRVTIARSKNVFGPYEGCPYNPILTNMGTAMAIKAIGHADLVDDVNGNWWAVCLGIRPLGYPFTHNMGRETMLTHLTWENDWPVFVDGARVNEVMEGPDILTTKEQQEDNAQIAVVVTADGRNARGNYVPGSDMEDMFAGPVLHPSWNYVYEPHLNLIQVGGGELKLYGNEVSLSEDGEKAILLRRQEHFCFEAEVDLSFDATCEDEEAGLTIYMNPMHHYEAFVTTDGTEKLVVLRRRIGSLVAEENILVVKSRVVRLKLHANKERYAFFAKEEGAREFTLLGSGESRYLTTEVGGCFTGNYLGVFATGNGKKVEHPAIFTQFSYRGNVDEEK